MKRWLLIALAAALANAESPPNWWQPYAPPDATAVVGIEWNHLRHTPLADAIEARISPSGTLGFPDLDCLKQAREIVISSPELLAVIAGSFPPPAVQDQAERQGLRAALYRGMKLWLPSQTSQLGVAQVTDRLLLVGAQPTLQSAIDRSLAEAARPESVLLKRASAHTGALWVTAVKLPDPLAALFVPLSADASAFTGRITVQDGFLIEASFDARSDSAAAEFVQRLPDRVASLPAAGRSLDATGHLKHVAIALRLSPEGLLAALQSAPLPLTQVDAAPAPPAEPVPPLAIAAAAAADPEPATSFKFEVTHVEALQPRIIRIFNLEEGTREIVLPVPH